jgi:hypothetical protein
MTSLERDGLQRVSNQPLGPVLPQLRLLFLLFDDVVGARQ